MLMALIRKELLEHLISLRFLVLIVICITLIPLSFFVSYTDYDYRQSDFNQSEKINGENFENFQLIDVFKPGFSVIGYLPPSPLTVFAPEDNDLNADLPADGTVTLLPGSVLKHAPVPSLVIALLAKEPIVGQDCVEGLLQTDLASVMSA